MIPRVAKPGRSFKGAGLYYLHDKGASTKDRVLFSHTENLPTRDPDKAIKCMAWTAMNADQIKRRAGEKATGRKPTLPVYTYSLAWSPDQEPTKEQMIEAARETLKLLGMDKHEALFVAHSDTEHPHIHVIVNRVNPKTGISQPVPNDFNVFSRWAEAYERNHGKILCEQRVENNRRRDAGEYVKYDEQARATAFTDWRRKRANEAFQRRRAEARDQYKAHASDQKQLTEETKERITDTRASVREQYRPEWRELYARQRKEVANLKKLQQRAAEKLKQATRGGDVDRTGERAVRQLYSARNPQPVPGPLRAPKGRRASKQEKTQARSRTGPASGSSKLLHADKENRGDLREAFELSTTWAIELAQRHKKERAALSEHHRNKLGAEIQKIKNEAKAQRDVLKQQQKDQSQALTERHLAERRKADLDKREGRDKKEFQNEMRRKRTAAFDLTKEDIERKPSGPPKIADLFKRASGRSDEKDAKRDVSAAKETAEPSSTKRGGLADQFRKARDEGRSEDGGKGKDKSASFFEQRDSFFKDNAEDISQDKGRERSRERKPPGSKPD